ncbi:MAG TPA: histidine phosphatase family protein [Herpetosiphonaceae bacterium]
MESPSTRLILVRHGETEANVAGRMQGRSNDPLTPLGQRQVHAVAARLKREGHPIEALYTSSLLRACLTADAIGAELGLTPRLRDGLQEMHLGDLDGESAATLFAAMPRSLDESYPGGESLREFVERIMGTLYGIAIAHTGGTVAVVSHGGVISTALSIWKRGHGGAWREYAPDNCAISIVEFQAGPAVISVNDCTHLTREANG